MAEPSPAPPLPEEGPDFVPPLPDEPEPELPQPAVPAQSASDEADDDDKSRDGSDEDDDAPAQKKSKGKQKSADSEGDATAASHTWQAVWGVEQNAWYFWNTETGEVTWSNPLDPSGASSSSAPAAPPLPSGPAPATQPEVSFAAPPDVDPALAHLLPPDQRYASAAPGSTPGSQTALFNSRTGRFTAKDYQFTPDHLDEANRAKRMKSHYFDVDAWERQRNEEYLKRKRDEESGKAQKAVTKKDMERFKKKAAEKKARSQAWLRH